jgi:L-rhamnose isomerase/sugar isomerase
MDAFNTDVRPLLAEVRDEMGIDPEPVKAFKRSGYLEKVAEQRVGGSAMGWGA